MPRGKPVDPPAAKEVPYHNNLHGITWEDNFHWLRERDNPEVRQHLKRENAYAEALLSPHKDLAEALYEELVGRIEETSESAPYVSGGFVYKSRIEKGNDYRQYYRRKKGPHDNWEKYFDAQKEAQGKDYFDLVFLDISPNGQILAYATDNKGDELYDLRFRDLRTGTDLPDLVENISGEGEWDSNSLNYYYIKEDPSRRPYRLYKCALGSKEDKPLLVHEEKDPLFYLSVSKSQDKRYLFATSESKETTEVRYLDLLEQKRKLHLLYTRRAGIQYYVEHHEGSWLIMTNEGAPDFKLMRFPVNNHLNTEGTTLIPQRTGVRIEEIIPFVKHLVVLERENGLNYLCIRNFSTSQGHRIALQDSVYDLQIGHNEEYQTNKLTFVYSSPIQPQRTVRYDMETRSEEIIHSAKIPPGHVPDQYEVYRIYANSWDGEKVPVTVIHKKNLRSRRNRPLYLYGYGAYGDVVSTYFRSSWLSYLERDFTVAIAHVRGGGLLGEEWYQSGKLDRKRNSFHDFIATAEELIGRGYTNPGKLVIEGGSAGGLMIAAVLNLRPELFKAAVADVPFVDVLNTMLDESLPLTTFEYEEWGNPREKRDFLNIRAYSPCENIRRGPYPYIFATAGFNDPRVPYWEPAKWVSLIRKMNPGGNPAMLKTLFDSGHSGVSGRYDNLREIALTQTFLISRVFESIQQD